MYQAISEYETWLVLSDEEDYEVDKVRKKCIE